MKCWKDNNLSAIFEYPFDFDRYIEERVREIDNLDERRLAKEILLNGLEPAIRMMERKYQVLEQRIYEELEPTGKQYEIVTTIIMKEHYDATNRTLFPIKNMDLLENTLKTNLSTEEEIYLGTVFLKIGEKELESWKHEQQIFAVRKDETGNNIPFTVSIKPARRYLEEIEQMHQTFQDNMIPWKTVHVGYLERFFDVFIDKDIFGEGKNETSVDLSDLEIQWNKMAGDVVYGMIPLWNVERVSFDSERFKEATIEGIYYEHEINIDDWVETDGYLIEKNKDILEVRHERKRIVVTSTQEEFHGWKVLHFIQKETICSLDYQEGFLTNRRRDTFLGRFSACAGSSNPMTKAELFRRIMDLDIRDYIEITGYEICDSLPETSLTGGMNWFIKGGLIPVNCRRILLLHFQPFQPDHYLTDSMINFAVSSLQMDFIEYRLAGVRI